MAKLYVVATPIGNLGDITLRAIETLKNVDLIAAEDTRKAMILLSHFQIRKKLMAYHNANETRAAGKFLDLLHQGHSIALISEAGTPTISDPGYRLIRAATQAGIEVVSIPGPCAAITALSISGFPTDRFLFLGFLPPKPGKKKQRLLSYADCDCQIVLYESPYRIRATLELLLELYGEREVFIGRELTKLHETHLRGNLSEILSGFDRQTVKGEFVIIINLKQGWSDNESDKFSGKETGVYDISGIG